MREITIILPDGTVDVRLETARNPFRFVVIGGVHRTSILAAKRAEIERYEQRALGYAATAAEIRAGVWTPPERFDSILGFCESVMDQRPSTRGRTGDAAIETVAAQYDEHAASERYRASVLAERADVYDATGTEWQVISCHGTQSAATRSARRNHLAPAPLIGGVSYDVIRTHPIEEMSGVIS